MFLIDGAKYKLWIPKDEEKEFHPMVKEHSKEIFHKDARHKICNIYSAHQC